MSDLDVQGPAGFKAKLSDVKPKVVESSQD